MAIGREEIEGLLKTEPRLLQVGEGIGVALAFIHMGSTLVIVQNAATEGVVWGLAIEGVDALIPVFEGGRVAVEPPKGTTPISPGFPVTVLGKGQGAIERGHCLA